MYSHVTCEVKNIKLKRQEEAGEKIWEMDFNRLKSQLCQQLAVWPCVIYFTSLNILFSSMKW